jgi:NADH dehydrogenase
MLASAVAGCTHAIHLVAIIRGGPEDFRRVMVEGTRNLLAAARAAGVERFVLMSALGTTEETKDLVPYYGAKWQMEQDVRASGIEHVIFRPSFVFGKSGGVLPTFVRQVRLSPVVTVVGHGNLRLQPIWIDDVAAHFAEALEKPEAANGLFELGGPERPTWDELYARIATVFGKQRRYVHVPFVVARTGARLVQWIPMAPITADQVKMLEASDNVVTQNDAAETFGLPLVPLDEQIRRVVA